MSEDFSYDPLVEARFLLGTDDKTVIAVEGDSDVDFFWSIFNQDKIEIINTKGRDNVCAYVKILKEKFPQKVFGICDSDLLKFGIGSHEGENIFHTDFHDLEMDALTLGKFEHFLSNSCSKQKLDNEGLNPWSLIQMALDLSYPLGLLRYINEDESLEIDFNAFKLRKDLAYNTQFQPIALGICTCVFRSEGNHQFIPRADEFSDKIAAFDIEEYSQRDICNGDDFVHCLSIIFKKYCTSNYVFNRLTLKCSLLASYTINDFKKSRLASDLPQSIFRDFR